MTLKLVPPIPAPDPHLRIVRDDEAEAAVSVAYLCERRVRAIVESNPNRMVSLTRDGAVTREVTVGYVLAALIARKKLADELLDPVAAEEKRARDAAMARRAAGLPDLCATCGAALGMSKPARKRRDRRLPQEWRCVSCGSRESQTPEQRGATFRKLAASLSPDERSRRARERRALKSPEARSEAARKGIAKVPREKLIAMMRRAASAKTSEQRSEAARKREAARRAARTGKR